MTKHLLQPIQYGLILRFFVLFLQPLDAGCAGDRETEWAVFTYLRQSHEQAGSSEEKERTSIL